MAQMNVYEMVTNKFLEKMSKGIIPWHKPWAITNGFLPCVSHTNGKPYSLLNQFLLDFEAGEYLTFNQVKSAGGQVIKGAKSKFVVFWSMFEKEETNSKGEIYTKQIPVLKYYNVFNINQTTGIEAKYAKVVPNDTPAKTIEKAEQIAMDYINREGIHFNDNGTSAYYCSSSDEVVVPNIRNFQDSELYYSTLFHELTHSTGCEKRLKRPEVGHSFFGSEPYSREELVAELGASFIVNLLGLDTEKSFDNSTAYLQSWLKVLENDPKMIVTASSKAEKAVEFILNNA